jgi:RNA polymerase sigma-70 factor (ECF subfamily)
MTTDPQLDRASAIDEQLAELASAAGSSESMRGEAVPAFEELYHRHARLLLAFVAARCESSEVDDIFQTVWSKVWKHLSDRFHGGSFRGWLYQIARNSIIDRHRTRKPTAPADENQPADDAEPLTSLLDEERMRILEQCFSNLDDREAGVLRGLLAGDSYDEVCSRQQINSNVAYKTARAARLKLKSCVDQKLS